MAQQRTPEKGMSQRDFVVAAHGTAAVEVQLEARPLRQLQHRKTKSATWTL
jgi:hypothetical protein